VTRSEYERLCALLAMPDPKDLVTPAGLRRGHKVTQPARARDIRRRDVLPKIWQAFAQHRHLATDGEPYIAPAREVRLRVVRRQA
jgi:hypothetical protein